MNALVSRGIVLLGVAILPSCDGRGGDGGSTPPAMLRVVAFQSDATTLVAGDTNGRTDVFVRDLALGTTVRASVSTLGAEGDGDSNVPSASSP